jgi:hypothetical protein
VKEGNLKTRGYIVKCSKETTERQLRPKMSHYHNRRYISIKRKRKQDDRRYTLGLPK